MESWDCLPSIDETGGSAERVLPFFSCNSRIIKKWNFKVMDDIPALSNIERSTCP